MTAVMVNYLENNFPEEMEELKLVFQKAQRFLKKWLSSFIKSIKKENVF